MTRARRFKATHSSQLGVLAGRVGLFMPFVCFLALGVLAPEAGAQIDPLVYVATSTTTRWTLYLAHSVDSALSEDGRAWRSDESTIQVAVERLVAPDLAVDLALAGSHISSQLEGEPPEGAWAVDRFSVTFVHPFASSWLGGRPTLSGGAHLPLGTPAARVGYDLRASSTWLSDPLALEVEAGLQAAPEHRPIYDLGATVTFVANRRLSLVSRAGLGDVLGAGPNSTLWLGIYHHAPGPSGPLWGFGLEHAVESGRTLPGLQLYLSLAL